MFEHRRGLAAIELHGKLGAEVVEGFVSLQRDEDPLSQWTCVEQHLAIDPGTRAEHQVAYVIARRVLRPQTGGQQALDQCRLLTANPAYLQIGAVGRLDRATGKTFCRTCHCLGLKAADRTAAEFDPADSAIQRRDNTQQPRTGRGA
ncbi:hypothetical protein D3C87_1089510 [compost metagenome]